jgi:hypothetical protein
LRVLTNLTDDALKEIRRTEKENLTNENEIAIAINVKGTTIKEKEIITKDNKITNEKETLPKTSFDRICPLKSPHLLGPLQIIENVSPDLNAGSKEFVDWFGSHLKLGGSYKPPDCIARQKVAVVVPFRFL